MFPRPASYRGSVAAMASTLLGALLAATAAHADFFGPTDPNILYTGRWENSNPFAPWAQAQGSSIIVNFEGTSIAATVNTISDEFFRFIIDDQAFDSNKWQLPSGTPITLVSGLTDGVHKLELVKETDVGRVTFLGLELDAGKSLVAPPAPPPRRIVFYGDSNLAGYSLESERNQGGNVRVGSYFTYAGITARMFDAENHNISRSGATIGSLNNAFDRIDWTTSSPLWNFNLFPADVVVVNIGANDAGGVGKLKGDYHALLDDLRVAHPTSHIMLYNAYGWDFGEPANFIHEVIAEHGDPNMSSAIFPWLFERFHGCETDHAGMAQYLAEHLTSVTGWTPSASDVMSGYGKNGNVANGSFEERAPFGGWGWRYANDSGVNAVNDPPGAYHGDHYLRLYNGGASHQSNPASDGDPVTVTAWIRAETAGDEVDISIDFRNQDQGAEPTTPVQIATETKTLTTEWQQVSMTSTAPVDGPDPIYSYRIAFQSGAGDTVHIDQVITTVPEPSEWLQMVAGVGFLLWLYRKRARPRHR